jgi:hypothetical protein
MTFLAILANMNIIAFCMEKFNPSEACSDCQIGCRYLKCTKIYARKEGDSKGHCLVPKEQHFRLESMKKTKALC